MVLYIFNQNTFNMYAIADSMHFMLVVVNFDVTNIKKCDVYLSIIELF